MGRMNAPPLVPPSFNKVGGERFYGGKEITIHKYSKFAQLSRSKMWVKRGESDYVGSKIIKKEENRRVFSVSKGKF